MTKPNPGPEIADEVPWSDHVTEYDDRHDTIYLRLLDAEAEGASKEDMARQILGIDPAREPERARKAPESHLARARWMTEVGYRELVRCDQPNPRDPLVAALILGSLPDGTPRN